MSIDSRSTGQLHGLVGQWLQRHQALLFLTALAVLSRLLPHPDNITPMAAIGLFAGAHIHQRYYFLVPVVAALISDLLGPGIYAITTMIAVYAGYLGASVVARLLLHRRKIATRLPITIVAGAVVFYLISNLGSWWGYYSHDLAGLIACYTNGLPYLLRSLLGDAFYSVVFFGLYSAWSHTNTAQRYA